MPARSSANVALEALDERRVHAVARPWMGMDAATWERTRPRPWIRWIDVVQAILPVEITDAVRYSRRQCRPGGKLDLRRRRAAKVREMMEKMEKNHEKCE